MSTIPDPPTVDLSNPEAAKRWAGALREQIDRTIVAGYDAAAPAEARTIGHRASNTRITAAAKEIEDLFASAGFADVGPPRSALVRRMVGFAAEDQHKSEARGETRLDWNDAADVRRFLVNLRVAFDDADAVALDMLRRYRSRTLGPAECRRLYREATDKIAALLAYAGLEPIGSAGNGGAPATGAAS